MRKTALILIALLALALPAAAQTVYNYHPETGEYTDAQPAKIDPKESAVRGQDVYLVPKYATATAPPEEIPAYTVAAWINGGWVLTADYRGAVEYDLYGQPSTITALGVTPNGRPAPGADLVRPFWDGVKWIENATPEEYAGALEAAKAAGVAMIESALSSELAAGFTTSDAIKIRIDPVALFLWSSAYQASKESGADIVARDYTGYQVTITAADMAKYYAEVLAHVTALKVKEAQRLDTILRATDIATVKSINWKD